MSLKSLDKFLPRIIKLSNSSINSDSYLDELDVLWDELSSNEEFDALSVNPNDEELLKNAKDGCMFSSFILLYRRAHQNLSVEVDQLSETIENIDQLSRKMEVQLASVIAKAIKANDADKLLQVIGMISGRSLSAVSILRPIHEHLSTSTN